MNTHRAVIETSVPPGMLLVGAGPLDFCEQALTDWVAKHPLGEYDRGLIVEVATIREADPPDEFVASEEELAAAVEDAKREILADLGRAVSSRGTVMPLSVSSFSELHDYVDANEYAGLCDDERRSHWVHATPSVNELQDRVDAWLQAGDHRVEKVAMVLAGMFSPAITSRHKTWDEFTEDEEGGKSYWRHLARNFLRQVYREWAQ